MTYEDLKREFRRKSFREKLKKELGCTCANCGSTEEIEYHHIVPLINGGTNRLSNIVPLCNECHCKAHDKKHFKSRNGGRPRATNIEIGREILDKYFNLEIGAKEAKKLLGLTEKNKSTWFRLLNEYKEVHNIDKNFKNTVDLINAQERRLKSKKENQTARKKAA